jgi:hypothetical protein
LSPTWLKRIRGPRWKFICGRRWTTRSWSCVRTAPTAGKASPRVRREINQMDLFEQFLGRLDEREWVDPAKEARRKALELKRQQEAQERARLRAIRKRPCGAKTRKGHPCRAKGLGRGGKCKFHGGASTGPTTQNGRDRIAAAARRRWAEWRAARSASP